jgi:hypothetical protein
MDCTPGRSLGSPGGDDSSQSTPDASLDCGGVEAASAAEPARGIAAGQTCCAQVVHHGPDRAYGGSGQGSDLWRRRALMTEVAQDPVSGDRVERRDDRVNSSAHWRQLGRQVVDVFIGDAQLVDIRVHACASLDEQQEGVLLVT